MGGAKFCRFALFPLMLLMLLLMPTRMVAETDYDTSVTFSALAGNPEGYDNQKYPNLVDGNNTKWCCAFDSNKGAYVIFEASKAGVPVGYTITTGDDNASWRGRNPLSWKLYGNNEGKDGAWVLIDAVENDATLKDENYTSYDFPCEGSTSYQYFKWEISAIHSGSTLQVGEFELKLNTCTHLKADGSSAFGEAKSVEATCTEHGYTAHKCSLCNSIVKVYKDDVLKPHKLTHHALKNATCTEAGNIEYWQCSVCNKLFSDANATTEITDVASLVIPAKGHTFDREGNCTVCHYKDSRYALFNLEGITDVTITDNGSYPWQMLDLGADGMSAVSSYFTEGSTGLMSSNYGVNNSKSEIEVKFNVVKPILFSFKYLISAISSYYVSITLNGKPLDGIRGTEQKVYKSILNKGEYTLTLSYNTPNFGDGNEGADRAFIYDLKAPTTISDYVAEYDATNTTLTFKKITSDNLESIDLSRLVIVNDKPRVKDMCDLLGIETTNIKNIVFDESFKTYAPTSLAQFFSGSSTLETISGLEYLNTEKVTDMSSMFDGCQKLSSLDLSNFNTANVTNMSGMFNGCQKLSSLELSNFNTAKVVNMSNMFNYCQNLSKLDVSNFNTEKLWTMSCMFQKCKNLTSLDLSNFNTKSVKEMAQMFYGCSTLQNIYVSKNFVTGQVYAGYSMFYGCTNLKGYSDRKTSHTYANCGPDGYFTPGCWYAEFDNSTGTLTFKCGLSKPAGAYDLNVGNNTPEWRRERAPEHNNDDEFVYTGEKINIKKVVFDASFANARPTSCYKWFDMCTSLTEIEGIENLNTEKVTNMGSMFSGCYVLNPLDVSNFNTQNVEDMSDMFVSCMNLKSLNVSNFDTQKVKDMNDMFYNCNRLTSLDVSNFNTQNVENMSYMFSCCEGLNSLDLSKFDTQNVTNMSNMFWNSSALTTIYASDKFVITKVSSGAKMFEGCTSLKGAIAAYSDSKTDHTYANCGTDGYFTPGCGYAEYDLSSKTLTFRYKGVKPAGAYDLNVGNNEPGWLTQKENIYKVVFDASFANARPTSCCKWFDECKNLTDIEGIENLNTEKVTNMGSMFSACFDLTSLDVSNFNTQNVENMSDMFWNCLSLTSLNVSNFDTQKVKYMSNMFYNCVGLTSLDVSNFNTQNVENMSFMFSWCEGLNSLDLSKFDTQNVTNMSYMFWNSSALTTIYVSDKFVTTKVSLEADDMFKGCTSLKGAIDKYEDSKTDHTYANYTTGYFTKLVGKNGEEKIGATGELLLRRILFLTMARISWLMSHSQPRMHLTAEISLKVLNGERSACLSPLTRVRKQNVSSIVSQVLTMIMIASPLRVTKEQKSLPALRCSSR